MARMTFVSLSAFALLLTGCVTTPPLTQEIQVAGYTVSIPSEVEVSRTLRPLQQPKGGIAPSSHGRDLAIYPGTVVLKVPHHRGTLVLFDPDSPAHYAPDQLVCALELGVYRTCLREGFYNGMHATETLGEDPNGHFYRTVHYERCGNEHPAGLVGHYEDASLKTKNIFDAVLRSVRK